MKSRIKSSSGRRPLVRSAVLGAVVLFSGCRARLPVPSAPPVPALLPTASEFVREAPAARAVEHRLAGNKALRAGRARVAAGEFHACLVIDPGNRDCLDGKGRAHAALREWEDTVSAWEELARAAPDDKDLGERLSAARKSLEKHLSRRAAAALRFPIGTGSEPDTAPLRLRLVARFQRYSTATLSSVDVYDTDIDSPKSVLISTDGAVAYVNSLEGGSTVIYDARSLAKRGAIRHRFGPGQSGLFPGREPWFGFSFADELPPGGPNVFSGKPVESAFSHGGRFVWVPYYRRNFDLDGTQPSAVAVIDAAMGGIARVLPTGPIAKNAAASPDGKYMAVAHWGGNSVGFIDISSSSPAGFFPSALVPVASTQIPAGAEGMDRDRECGLCVRGLAWSRDSAFLFAGCMGGPGGVAVINVSTPGGPLLAGRVNVGGNPRDIVVSPDGIWLYIASGGNGSILRARIDDVLAAAAGPAGSVAAAAVRVGGRPRSMRISPDGRWLFAAINSDSRVAAVDLEKMRVVARIGVDSFPVGMDITPDGRFLWVTSQGIDGAGGNSVSVFEITASSAGGRHRMPPLP